MDGVDSGRGRVPTHPRRVRFERARPGEGERATTVVLRLAQKTTERCCTLVIELKHEVAGKLLGRVPVLAVLVELVDKHPHSVAHGDLNSGIAILEHTQLCQTEFGLCGSAVGDLVLF